MAAPLLWTPGTKCLLQENLHVHKIPRFFLLGGGDFGFGGRGSADFIFMGGGGIFLI